MTDEHPDEQHGGGTLGIDDGVCEQLARRCERLRSDLDAVIERLQMFAPTDHTIFGDCAEGRGWQKVVQSAATGSDGSLTRVLEEHCSMLTGFADNLRRTSTAYLETESASADRCRAVGLPR